MVPFDRGRLCVPGVPARSDSFTGPKGSPRSNGPFITQSLLLPALPHLFSSQRGCPLVSGISPSVSNGLSAASSRRCLIEKIRSQIASKDSDTFPWLSSSLPCLWTHKTKSPLHSFPLFTPCLAQPPKQTQLRTDKQTNRQTANKRQTRIKDIYEAQTPPAWTVDTWKVILKLIKLI